MSVSPALDAMLFDFYGTLVDIRTDESSPTTWKTLARFLRYRGLHVEQKSLSEQFAALVDRQRRESRERWPETDLEAIFQAILRSAGYRRRDSFAIALTQLFRILTMRRFRLFPDALRTLQFARKRYKVGMVSDAQRAFLIPELEITGVAPFLDVLVVSSDHGFRKPDPRLFSIATDQLGVAPERTVHVGDNLCRDVCGARAANLRTVLVKPEQMDVSAPESDPACGGRHCQPDYTISSLRELIRLPLL